MFFACFSCGVWYEAQQRYASTVIFNCQFSIFNCFAPLQSFSIFDFCFARRQCPCAHPKVTHIRFYNAINYLLLFDAKVKRLVFAMWINEDKRG